MQVLQWKLIPALMYDSYVVKPQIRIISECCCQVSFSETEHELRDC